MELADLIMKQPLALRVIVNRVWKGHFGTGLVDSPSQLFRAAVGLYGRTDGGYTARALREEPTARDSIEAMLRDNAVTRSTLTAGPSSTS